MGIFLQNLMIMTASSMVLTWLLVAEAMSLFGGHKHCLSSGYSFVTFYCHEEETCIHRHNILQS